MIPWFVYVPMVGGAAVVLLTTTVWMVLAIRLLTSRTKPYIAHARQAAFPRPDSRDEVVEGRWRWVT